MLEPQSLLICPDRGEGSRLRRDGTRDVSTPGGARGDPHPDRTEPSDALEPAFSSAKLPETPRAMDVGRDARFTRT